MDKYIKEWRMMEYYVNMKKINMYKYQIIMLYGWNK